MCGRYGIVLDRPTWDDPDQGKELRKQKARNCPSYGEELPPVPVEHRLTIAFPESNASRPEEPDGLVNTCATCKNFVRDDVAFEATGLMTGYCAAKGRLILPARQRIEARDCEYREFGPVREDMPVDFTFLPEYADNFGKYDPVAAFLAAKEDDVDPAVYESDREVTDAEKADGIRAWRRVTDNNDHEAFLPVYDTSIFTEDELDMIPKSGDPEHPELYVDHFGGVYMAAVCWTELDETPMCWGEAGTGKTELFRHLAYLMQVPFRRMSITGSTELDDLAGKMLFIDNETKFQYGRLSSAWTRPGVICIDEPNTGPADVWQFIRPLTDNSKQLVLDMNKGEVIKRHPDAYLGMAANPAWDVRNVGALPIGDADANRLFHMHVPLPDEALEKEIIKARVKLDGWEIEEPMLKMVMRIATDIRALATESIVPITWAIRPQIKVARALRWFDPITAYRRAVVDFLDPEAGEQILNIVRSHAPESRR